MSSPGKSVRARGGATEEQVDEASGLRPSELALLKRRLEDDLASVRERLRQRMSTLNEGDIDLPDEMDQATRDQERGSMLQLAEKERKLLQELEHALAKVDAGTYGVCEGTDEPIGFGRLNARPWARYSIAYKEQLEHDERDEKLAR
jgi:DnaK suppressor protein